MKTEHPVLCTCRVCRGIDDEVDERANLLRTVAAYLVDRADQYETDSGSWVPLIDAAKALVNGEFEAAVAHGELEDVDLLKRVDRWAK